MSNQPGKFRDDQVLVICPGSQMTVAALGVSELLVPTTRIRTRMFPDPDIKNHYIPYHTYKRKKIKPALSDQSNDNSKPEEDEYEYVEDPDSDEGAVYPMVGGRIVNMTAFLGFLEHVHSLLTNSYHNTPILLMASPQWRKRDHEMIAQYIFEKTKTPALCLCMSSVATSYGIGKSPHLTVVDIGYEKVDVTCLYDFCPVSHNCEGAPDAQEPHKISGGEAFTRRLMEKLQSQNFTHQMAEQLKKSPICEVLPYAADKEALMDLPVETASGPATTTTAEGAAPLIIEPTAAPTAPNGVENSDGTEKNGDNDGVLDVASIVVSGQTKEFLARKEKEKADRVKQKKGKGERDAQDAGIKPTKLPNSKRLRNVFHYEEIVEEEVVTTKMKDVTIGDGSTPANGEDIATEVPKPDESAVPERQIKKIRRDIEVGLERFTFADRREIDRIVSLIYRTVQEIGDMYMRPACWENLVFVGNGSRLKGLRENIMQTLQARHLVSPSTATMFMSELPSNIGTPSGTGSQTPMRDFNTPPVPNPSNVNPLLLAATTASLQLPRAGDAGSNAGDHRSTHFHSQTPTKIGLAPLPAYLGEWTKHGYEEAMILGSLVCARIAFTSQHADKDTLEHMKTMSLSRVDYNELGPKGIHSHNMLLV